MSRLIIYNARKVKFSIEDFFSKCDQILRNGKLRFVCSVMPWFHSKMVFFWLVFQAQRHNFNRTIIHFIGTATVKKRYCSLAKTKFLFIGNALSDLATVILRSVFSTAWKASKYGVFLLRIFPYLVQSLVKYLWLSVLEKWLTVFSCWLFSHKSCIIDFQMISLRCF